MTGFHRVNRWIGAVIAVGLLLPLIGCDETKQNVVWSPDGKQAAVIGTKGLYLCDGDGKLSGLLVPGATQARWLADSRRLVVVRVVEPKSWPQVAELLTEAERKYVAGEVASLLDRWSGGGKENGTNKAAPSGEAEPRLLSRLADRKIPFNRDAAGLYVRDELAETFVRKMGEAGRKFLAESKDQSYAVWLVQVYEVAGTQVRPGAVVARSLANVVDMRVSPSGRVLAFTAAAMDGTACDLYVAPTDPAAAGQRCVADRVAAYPDWSADGQSLVYCRANLAADRGDAVRLGSLRWIPVCDAGGTLLADFQPDEETPAKPANGPNGEVSATPSPAQDLAGLLFTPTAKVRCLKDGTILFSGVKVTLPATAEDMPTRGTLFAIDPRRQRVVARAAPAQSEEQLPDEIYHFEPSPDQTRVAFGGPGGQVVVLTLATGQVVEVTKRLDVSQTPMVPAWRSNDELCYAEYNKEHRDKRPAEVYLWSAGNPARAVSGNWPDDVVKALPSDQNTRAGEPQSPEAQTTPQTRPATGAANGR